MELIVRTVGAGRNMAAAETWPPRQLCAVAARGKQLLAEIKTKI
jgi:hypothetical protein